MKNYFSLFLLLATGAAFGAEQAECDFNKAAKAYKKINASIQNRRLYEKCIKKQDGACSKLAEFHEVAFDMFRSNSRFVIGHVDGHFIDTHHWVGEYYNAREIARDLKNTSRKLKR